MYDKSILKLMRIFGSSAWVILSGLSIYFVFKGLYYSFNKDDEIKEMIIKGLKDGSIQRVKGGYFVTYETISGLRNPGELLRGFFNDITKK